MPKVMCLYLDDSGTRNPDRKPATHAGKDDWFALGGILINEEDEDEARALHAAFCAKWKIDYPLHSSEIRNRVSKFSWLATLGAADKDSFMRDLSSVAIGIPALGHACVVDRPGYDARYREKYGRRTWMLCKTAFSVVCERSAKFAASRGRKLRVYPERGDKSADSRVRSYYEELRESGMPFAAATSEKYGPMSAADLKATLYDLKFRTKESQMAQLADLYLYPIARGGYVADYLPYKMLRESKKLVDALLDAEQQKTLGIKYSCFDHGKA